MNGTSSISNQTQKVTLIFAIAFFVFVILIVSISTAFFSSSATGQGQIALGELDFCIYSTDAQNSVVMPYMFVGQTASITNSRNQDGSDYQNLCNILFKFSIYVTIDGKVDKDIVDDIDFYINNAKYIKSQNEFYYLGFLTAGQSETIFNDVFLDSRIGNLYQGKEINFIISVDAIQAENDAYKDLWSDAPIEWTEQIESILQ